MPRRNGAPAADDAARAARRRFAARLAPPLADPGGAHAGHDGGLEPLLPLRSSIEHGSGTAGFDDAPEDSKSPVRLRWRTPWRVAVLLAVPCLLLLLWFAWQAWTGQPTVEPLVRDSFAGGTEGVGTGNGSEGPGHASPESNASSESQGGQLTVHVVGAVKNPGIVRLPAGARVFDAIAAAGGAEPAAELNSLNLAAVVQDAAKIHVPRTGEVVPAPAAGTVPGTGGTGGASGTGNVAGGKVNLNTATAEELDALPKVGPVLAKRIVEWRQQHGPFAAVEDLDAVDGVGPKMMESLLPLVTV